MNSIETAAISELISSSSFNETQYIRNRLEAKINQYIIEKNKYGIKTSKYDTNDSDIDNIIEIFINEKTNPNIYSLYLKYRFDNPESREKLKLQISIIINNKKEFKNLWRENHEDLKESLLEMFQSNKDKSLNKFEISRLFLEQPIVKKIDATNDYFLSKNLTIGNWDSPETIADKRVKDLINKIKHDFRTQDNSQGYIILESIKMLKNQIVDGERTIPSAWKYTENWPKIREYCAASAIEGATRVLGNLLFLAKNNQIDNIENQINDVQLVIEKLEKEIKGKKNNSKSDEVDNLFSSE